MLGFVAVAPAQKRVNRDNRENRDRDPNNLWWLTALAIIILGGGYWLIWGQKVAPDNATIIAEAKAFYEAHPLKVGDEIVAFNDGSGDEGGDDFDLPDFDPDHERMLLNQFQSLISAAAFQCMGAIEGGNPGAACRGIVEYFNNAHRVIERMHPVLRFAAHAAYCLQLLELRACCDIETLKKLGLECACGMDIPHNPFPPFSAN